MLRLPLPSAAEFSFGSVGIDVDGVLRDTGWEAYLALCETVLDLGGRVPYFAEFVQEYHPDFPTYFASLGVRADQQTLQRAYYKNLVPHENASPFSDVVSFLDYLCGLDVPVFVVSSHPTDRLNEWFRKHELVPYFATVVGGSRDKSDCIVRACREICTYPESAIFIGDWGSDMRGALGAGALPIGVTRGYLSRQALLDTGAGLVVDHLSDLQKLITSSA